MSGLRSSFLCFAVAAFAASAAAAAVTTIPDYLVGWYHLPIATNSWTAVSCASGYTYTQTDSYAACAHPKSDVNFPTDCEYGTLTYDDGDHAECASTAACQTMTIYQSATTDPRRYYIFCQEYWERSTIFRQTPASATSPPTGTTGPTPGPAATGAFVTSTNPPSSKESDDGDDGSKAWIAGAVVGPVAGCAIIAGGLGFWLYRRGSKKGRESVAIETVQSPQTMQSPQMAQGPPIAAPMQGYYEQPKEHGRPLSELPSA